MDNKSRIINWIENSLSQAPNSLTESFYFDREKQMFFSIHAVDYFMLTEDLEIDPLTTVSYSPKTQQKIVEWIKRLERNDESIIQVPQKGITDDKLKKIEAGKFIHSHSIDTDSAKVWRVESTGSAGFDLTDYNEVHKLTKKNWWRFWKQ